MLLFYVAVSVAVVVVVVVVVAVAAGFTVLRAVGRAGRSSGQRSNN